MYPKKNIFLSKVTSPSVFSPKEVKGICQCLLVFFKEICLLSTTSIVCSNDSIVRYPCCCGAYFCFSLLVFFAYIVGVCRIFS